MPKINDILLHLQIGGTEKEIQKAFFININAAAQRVYSSN